MGSQEQDLADEVTQLSLQLEGLSVSITRTRSRTAAVSQAVSPVHVPRQEAVQVRSAPLPSAGERPVSASVRDQLERSFPPLPERLAALAERQLSSGALAPRARALRAWIAGHWARAVLSGRVPTPCFTPRLALPNRFYAVARSSDGSAPAIYSSREQYIRAVANFSDSLSVSQGFPSETEGRIYLEAAGLFGALSR